MTRFAFPRLPRRLFVAVCLLLAALALGMTALPPAPVAVAAAPKRLLVVTVTKGFRHDCIPVSEEVLAALGQKSGAFTVDFVRTDAEMAEKMTPEGLKRYDGVFFANTTGDLPIPDRDAFLKWIADGHAFIGAHAATDTYHNYPPYIQMIGGEFKTHGPQVEVECLNEDPKHPANKPFGASFKVFDEIYQFKSYDRSRFRGLLTLDKHPNNGQPGDYPIAWCRREGKGRVFYTALGHRKDVWNAAWYQAHLLGGIRWALGLEKGDDKPQDTAAKLTTAERREGFRPLFNGRDLTGWRLRRPDGKASWSAQNGMLVNAGGGTDLVTDETFGDFTVRYDYMVPKGGNSGFYLRGRYEIQVSDDFDSRRISNTGNGSIYGKAAPSVFASKPAGQWQQAEATVIGNQVTVTLNGTKIVNNFPVPGVCGLALDDKVSEPGPILLQGDHSAVAYRNIRIKPLRPTVSALTAAGR